MKKMIMICIALSLALSMHSAEYKAFDGKKVTSTRGLVGLHEVESKIYLDVPRALMGRRFLTGTVVEQCSDMLESNIGYQPVEPYIVSFRESCGSLILYRLNSSYNASAQDNNLSASNINTVERMFEIKEFSSDSSSVLIDATSYFLSHDKSMDPIDPKAFNAAEGFVKRTGSYIPKTTLLHGFTAGEDCFSVSVSNSYKMKAAFLGIFASDDQAVLTSVVRRNFVLLPEVPMTPVKYDVKVGTYSVSLEDYDHGKPKSSSVKYATRWRLDVGEDGVVTKPVIFYVDDSFPETWKTGILASVREWNNAFRKIGLDSVLQARMYTGAEDVAPSDIRSNFIMYNLSPAEKITDNRWCDPSTGEILGAGIVVNHGVSELIKKNLLLQTSAGSKDSRAMTVDSVLFASALKSMLVRHVGHCLGLSDNMAGSHAYPVDSLSRASFTSKYGISSSVMDELPFNFIAYSSDNVEDGVMMMQDAPGEYDLYALSRLYGGTVDKCNAYFGKRQKLTDFYDPRSMSFDLGDDSAASVEKGLAGLGAVIRRLNEWISEEDPDYNFREGLQEAVVLQAYEYMKQVFVNLGGIYVSPKEEGDLHNTYASVPKDVQRRHLLWALERIDDLSFLDSEQLKEDSPLRGDTGEFCQVYFTNFIFIQLDAMWLSEIRSADPYTQEQALSDVGAHIWKGAERGCTPTDLQKYQRYLYIDNLLSWAGVRGNYYFREPTVKREVSRPDKTHIWYGKLMETKKLLEKACRKARTPEAENHYRFLLHTLNRYL